MDCCTNTNLPRSRSHYSRDPGIRGHSTDPWDEADVAVPPTTRAHPSHADGRSRPSSLLGGGKTKFSARTRLCERAGGRSGDAGRRGCLGGAASRPFPPRPGCHRLGCTRRASRAADSNASAPGEPAPQRLRMDVAQRDDEARTAPRVACRERAEQQALCRISVQRNDRGWIFGRSYTASGDPAPSSGLRTSVKLIPRHPNNEGTHACVAIHRPDQLEPPRCRSRSQQPRGKPVGGSPANLHSQRAPQLWPSLIRLRT